MERKRKEANEAALEAYKEAERLREIKREINKKKARLIKILPQEVQKEIYKGSRFRTDVTFRLSWVEALREFRADLLKQVLRSNQSAERLRMSSETKKEVKQTLNRFLSSFNYHRRFTSIVVFIIMDVTRIFASDITLSLISGIVQKAFVTMFAVSVFINAVFSVFVGVISDSASDAATPQKRKRLTVSEKVFCVRIRSIRQVFTKTQGIIYSIFFIGWLSQ